MSVKSVAGMFLKIMIIVGLSALLIFDPTVKAGDNGNRMKETICAALCDGARLTYIHKANTDPDQIPLWIRYHPRKLKWLNKGTPDATLAYLIDCSPGLIRCYTHSLCGGICAFTVQYSEEAKVDALNLAKKLRTKFWWLPVKVRENTALQVSVQASTVKS